MPKKFLQGWLPSSQKIMQMRIMRYLGQYTRNPRIWYINRRSISRAVLIGTFWGLMPIPFHTVLIIMTVLVFNANLPIGLLLSWLTNPLTVVPIIYGGFWIGSKIYHVHMIGKAGLMHLLHQLEHWIVTFGHAKVDLSLAKILMSGLVIECTIAALVAYMLTLLAWRLSVIKQWKARRQSN